jgi:hypothetical protein
MTDEVWKIQYEKMLTFWADEGTRFWTRFQVFLAVNTGLLGIFSIVLNFQSGEIMNLVQRMPHGVVIISIMGIVVSVTWCLLVYSGAGIQKHWKEKINEMEEAHATDIPTKIDFDRGTKLHMSKLAMPIPIAFSVIWIIVLCYGLKQI